MTASSLAQPEDWRRRAEQRLAEAGDPSLGWGEAMRLVHELRVHQIELELQNEALQEARLEAESSGERFQELYDFAPVGYFSLDEAGLILQLNFAGARLLGSERAALINRRFAQFLSSADRSAFASFLRKGLANPVAQTCEVSLAGEGAADVWVRLESAPADQGRVLRLVAMDISQLRATQNQVTLLNGDLERRVQLRTAQLESANADLQAFSYMISHELRAPLARMQGFSRMILPLLKARPDQLGHIAQRIEASSLRMREVIDTLLQMTRLALAAVHLEPVDLSQLVGEAVEALVQAGWRRPDRVIIQAGVTVLADRRMLELCLRNLLQNAVKFSAKTVDSLVEFGVLEDAGTPVYYLRDNGVGFDMAHAGKLFQAFVRLHRQEAFEGTGVGLNLVRKILEKHGGRVWGESSPGLGATFFFTLS